NGKRDGSAGRVAVSGGAREELQLVRDAISSLRSNFRETDPNQHTLDTLEQAIAVLIERAGSVIGVNAVGDKSSRPVNDKRPVNGLKDPSTKIIYFTERTVTPFMSTINKRLGDIINLQDLKYVVKPETLRFHFKSHDPEYGMVKEEIFNDDDILPGVDGKIIAWVEEDTE
ncbi:LOW QUALITY PROTEIN: dixin-A-like, partial [Penaeus japonicus]|uniref:LOW QUALITY PROTEIN: dixin-A-like n=1 Tax=Penaeus japonicus TaxID=27405 RepID=UPI001C716383